jgi:hypothetical protein
MNKGWKRSLACLLVLSLLIISGFASAQALTHESQHSHHQKATHATVLCSWMCAAGQVLDSLSAPSLIEQSPVAFADEFVPPPISFVTVQFVSSRGPPASTAL